MIYFVDEELTYAKETIGRAVPETCRRLGVECCVIPADAWSRHETPTDQSNQAVVLLQAAHGQNWNVTQIRERFPNGKLVVLGGDTIWSLANNKPEPLNPHEVDFWWDTMDEVIEQFTNEGINTDKWMWTASEVYMERIRQWRSVNNSRPKQIDAICLITMNHPYRRHMETFFRERNISCLFGNGSFSSHDHILFPAYADAWVSIGTTSPSWTGDIRTMKGFRDWIAPCIGTVLIYDDHPQIIRDFDGGNEEGKTVPLYNYENFDEIIQLINVFKEHPYAYEHYILRQLAWIFQNSLEVQFTNLFKKHNLV